MTRPQALLLSVLLGLGGLNAGCSGASDETPNTVSEPTLASAKLKIGYYTTDSFLDLAEVPDCPVLWGLQGGNWTMPTLRTQNFGPEINVSGSLQCGQELIGTATTHTTLVDRGDGWLELTYLPIPVSHAAPNDTAPIDDIYGQAGLLTFSLVDINGVELTARYPVTLNKSEVTE
jgi:hypothetical protein